MMIDSSSLWRRNGHCQDVIAEGWMRLRTITADSLLFPPIPTESMISSQHKKVINDNQFQNRRLPNNPYSHPWTLSLRLHRATPSPQPSQPSAFTIAMMRMVEMNADMEFAHAKLKMLEMEHKRVMARLDALKEVNRVEQDGS